MTRWIAVSVALTLIVLAACVYVSVLRTDLLREQIPTHWNANMEPDAWTDRESYYRSVLWIPGVMALMTILMVVLPAVSPKQFDVNRFAYTWGFLMTVVVGFLGYLGALMVWVAMDEAAEIASLLVAGAFVLFAVIGNMLGKVRRNFWMGIRTPWTLASETVWEQTHRQAAWLWVGAGIVGAIATLAGLPFWLGFALIMVVALWPVLYSLVLYKRLERQEKV